MSLVTRDIEIEIVIEIKEGAEFRNKLREDVNTLQDVIGKLSEEIMTLQDDYNAGRWYRKREEAYIKEIKEGAEFRSKLREDVNALQDKLYSGHEQEEAMFTKEPRL